MLLGLAVTSVANKIGDQCGQMEDSGQPLVAACVVWDAQLHRDGTYRMMAKEPKIKPIVSPTPAGQSQLPTSICEPPSLPLRFLRSPFGHGESARSGAWQRLTSHQSAHLHCATSAMTQTPRYGRSMRQGEGSHSCQRWSRPFVAVVGEAS